MQNGTPEGITSYPNIQPRYKPYGPSVYGDPDPITLRLLRRIKKHGKVLEVGAGDGRYTKPLLKYGFHVVAADVHEEPLRFLKQKVPKGRRHKLDIVRSFDAFKPFPYLNGEFDAVVCTALLYLYSEDYIQKFTNEAHRVLKKKGKIIVDFVTDRKRIDAQGHEVKGENEIQYDYTSGRRTIKKVLKESHFKKVKKKVSKVHQNLLESAGYTMEATKISIIARKR